MDKSIIKNQAMQFLPCPVCGQLCSALIALERHGKPDGAVLDALQALSYCYDFVSDVAGGAALDARAVENAIEIRADAMSAVETLEAALHSPKIAAAETGSGGPSEFWAGKAAAAFVLAEEIKLRKQLVDALSALLSAVKAEPSMRGREYVHLGIQVTNALSAAEIAPRAWECMGRKQSLPEPGECNWPDCGCDPQATKVIESLVEQGWHTPSAAIDRLDVKSGAKSPEAVVNAPHYLASIKSRLHQLYNMFPTDARLREQISDEVDWIEELEAHPTTKPEAPAVGVDAETIDAVARIIDPTAWKMEHGYWMEQAHAYEAISKATTIAALIAGGR